MNNIIKAALLFAALLCPCIALAQPRIVETHTASGNVIAVTVEAQSNETGINTAPMFIDTNLANWSINGQAPVAISRYSYVYDERPAITSISPNQFPVTSRTRVYLRMAVALADGTVYQIATPYGSTSLTFGSRATWNESIHCNQSAYTEAATSRYCNLGIFLGNAGSVRLPMPVNYQVFTESGSLVFSGSSSQEFDDTAVTTGPTSGEWVYRLPLGPVPTGGKYFVSITGLGRSRSFSIGGQAFRDTAFTVFRALFHQRCGASLDAQYTQWSRPICSMGHRQVADVRQSWSTNTLTIPAGTPTIQVIGGHHDAANYVRRPFHIIVPIELLTHAEAFPGSYADGTYNLPESGNGISDGVDEGMWAVRMWEALQITTPGDPKLGGVRAGVDEIHDPAYGVDYAAADPSVYGVWDVDGPAGSPAEGITAYAAGIFAQASRLIRPYNTARADALLNEANLAWSYVTRMYDMNATKTYLMYASLQLYLATGQQPFHDMFKRQVAAIVTVPPGGGTWPQQWASSNIAAECKAVHFMSYALPQTQPVDATIVAAIKARVLREADSGGYYGLSVGTTPYAFLARSFLDWGSMSAIRFDAPMFAYLFTTDPAKRHGYYDTISLMADYVLGVNALGRPYITGLGTDRLVSPLHADSYITEQRGIGPVPGLTIYSTSPGQSGQTYQLAVTGKVYPAFSSLPIERRWTDGWSAPNQNEHTLWETLIWNATAFAWLSGQAVTPPPPLDAGTVADASVDAAVDVYVPPDSGVAVDASRDTGVDASVDSGPVVMPDAGPVLVCIQPAPVCRVPPVVCGPVVPPPDSGTSPTLLMRRTTTKRLVH